MFFTKDFMNKLLAQLSNIEHACNAVEVRLSDVEERLQSDRRAVPVLKDAIKDLRNDKKDLLNRVMSKDFQELQVYTAHESESREAGPITLDEGFAGEILDLEKLTGKG